MNICVFCSAQNIDEKYARPALETVRGFAARGHSLVWGGSDTGLMNKVATEAQSHGAQIVGVSVEFLKQFARKGADEMIITENLTQRKEFMIARADAFLVLPGGLGTLDEVASVIEVKKHDLGIGPIVILNTDEFYDGLRAQLLRMTSEGFLPRPAETIVSFADHPEDALVQLGVDSL